MVAKFLRISLSAFLLVLWLAPLASSQQTVNLLLNNGGNYTMDGVYVGPYNFTETPLPSGSPQAAQLICDDFNDDVVPGESWTASVTSMSNLNSATGLMFEGSKNQQFWGASTTWQQGYEAMAYLAQQMLPLVPNSQNAQTIGYMAYAIWAVFSPTAVQSYLSAQHDSASWSAICNYVNAAFMAVEAKGFSLASLQGWEILTPITCDPNQHCPPQEYMQYVPEGGTALMYLMLAGGCIGAALFRRRKQALATR